MPMVLASFVRLVPSPTIFPAPTPVGHAVATIHLAEHLFSFDREFKKLIGRSQFTLLEPQTD